MPNCSSRKRWLQRRVKKNLFADLLATDVVQEIETLLGRQAVEDLDLEALELAVRQQVLQLAGAAVEQRLNADTSDARGSRTRCGCGQEARLVGRRSKQVHSVLGPLQLERAYYHCSSCGHGFCPRDGHLGIENTSLSPALTRMVGTVGAHGQLPGRQRAVDGTGRRGRGCQAGGENRRGPGRRNRRRRTSLHGTLRCSSSATNPVSRHGWN